MCVYSTVTVPPEEFLLGRMLRSCPEIRVELERAVLLDDESSPFLWIANASEERVASAVESESDIDHVEFIDRVDGELLVQIGWNDLDNGLVRTLVETEATCLRCTGVSDAWHLTLRFSSSAGLSECYRRWNEDGRRMRVQSIRNGARAGERHPAGNLSDPQREAIYAALRGGYFSVPRDVTLQELAERLNISDTAASQRIRRGLEKLLVNVDPDVRSDVEVPESHLDPSRGDGRG